MSDKKILIVEDDLFLRELYSDLLSSNNLNFEAAADGKEAYEKMQKGDWDLVLLDMNLPEMTGLEVLKKILALPVQPQIKKIIFLTNMEEGPILDEVKKLGYEYLTKSDLSPDQFLAQIQTYLQK